MNDFRKILENQKYKELIMTNVYFNAISKNLIYKETTNEIVVDCIAMLCKVIGEQNKELGKYVIRYGMLK